MFLRPHSTFANPPVPTAGIIEDPTKVPFSDKTLELAPSITKDSPWQELRTPHAKTFVLVASFT